MEDPLRECAARLRAVDFERYIAVTMAPPAARADLTALYCFHHEIGRVGDLVSEPLPGEIRLQWWRDAIAGEGHGDVTGHPVAALLLKALQRGAFAAADLHALIDARGEALYAAPPETMDAAERRLSATSGALLRIAARTLVRRDEAETGAVVDEAAHRGGLAEGLVGLVRNLGYDASHGRVALPLDLLATHGVHTRGILAGDEPQGLAGAVSAVLEQAAARLAAFRRAGGALPWETLPAFAPLALVGPRMSLLRRRRPLLAPPPDLMPLGVVLRLWRGRRGHFG